MLELEFQGVKKQFTMLQVLASWSLFSIMRFIEQYLELVQICLTLIASLLQTWPVRSPRPVASKLAADTPLLTGQVMSDAKSYFYWMWFF